MSQNKVFDRVTPKGNYFQNCPLMGGGVAACMNSLAHIIQLKLVLLQIYDDFTPHQSSVLSNASTMVYQLLFLTPQMIHALANGTSCFHAHSHGTLI